MLLLLYCRPHQFINPNKPDLTNYASVEDWLTSIKMDRYINHFLQYGITTMDRVAQITFQDLVNCGVTLVGHQKKIINSVQTLRAHMMPTDSNISALSSPTGPLGVPLSPQSLQSLGMSPHLPQLNNAQVSNGFVV